MHIFFEFLKDWAAAYSDRNPEIPDGACLVCSTNEALYAKYSDASVSETDGLPYMLFERKGDFVDNLPPSSVKLPLDYETLKSYSESKQFFSYAAGTAAICVSKIKPEDIAKHGIQILNYRSTLPLKKGLSSSAALCVLVASCFNVVYNMGLSMVEIMDCAYRGERLTGSQCGRMDQCVAMGTNSIALMTLRGGDPPCDIHLLECKSPLYFVFADLMASKNTVTILRDLNKCFPFPENPSHQLMHHYVKENAVIASQAIEAIKHGDTAMLADCMTRSQANFDSAGFANCPSELNSPKLHSIFQDETIRKHSLACKGVGSQGDGCIQVLCDSKESQKEIYNRLVELGCSTYYLTVNDADADEAQSKKQIQETAVSAYSTMTKNDI